MMQPYMLKTAIQVPPSVIMDIELAHRALAKQAEQHVTARIGTVRRLAGGNK